jgi:RNA polymerase sigma-70 factor (ECF subfamily)
MSSPQNEIARLYREHSYSVYRRCLRLLGNEDEARDQMHEVFLRYLEKPAAFKGRSKLSTYLFSMATHVCLNRVRSIRNRGDEWKSGVSQYIEESQERSGLEEQLHARRVADSILRESDEKTAEIAVYHFVDGLSQGEIATLVGLSRVRVNQRLKGFRCNAQRLLKEVA